MTDERVNTLVSKAQAGDVRAFEQLVEQYYPRIYNIALGMLGTSADAEDAAQTALIKMYRSIGGFKFNSKLSTWIYRITTNVCTDRLRKKSRTPSSSLDELSESGFDMASADALPEERVVANEKKKILYKGIERLKSEHKEIIVLRDINGFSYGEIAQILKCGEGTVKSRISRARASLKSILEESGYFGI